MWTMFITTADLTPLPQCQGKQSQKHWNRKTNHGRLRVPAFRLVPDSILVMRHDDSPFGGVGNYSVHFCSGPRSGGFMTISDLAEAIQPAFKSILRTESSGTLWNVFTQNTEARSESLDQIIGSCFRGRI